MNLLKQLFLKSVTNDIATFSTLYSDNQYFQLKQIHRLLFTDSCCATKSHFHKALVLPVFVFAQTD